MKGRKPTATAAKEASGAFVKHPERRNRLEPRPIAGQPVMPSIIDADPVARECWIQTCATLADMKILTMADASIMTLYCSTYSQWRWLSEIVKEGNCAQVNDKGVASQSPEAHQVHKYADRLVRLMSELGLTPSARTRLQVIESDGVSPFTQWLEEMGSG